MSGSDLAKEKGAYDPGWNDPPLFSYDTQQSQSVKRPQLTKRLAFPEEVKVENKGDGQSISAPPFTIRKLPPSSPFQRVPTSNDLGEGKEITPEEEIPLSSVIDNFDSVIEEVFSSGNEKKSVEVKRRLEVMKTMWGDSKFVPSMKDKILKLSKALKEGDLEGADSLQRSLMVDHPSLCSSWMSAIRQILNSKRLDSVSNTS